MSVHAISTNLRKAAETLRTTLNKDTVIVLTLDQDGAMEIGWSGNKTVNLLGLIGWAHVVLADNIVNEETE